MSRNCSIPGDVKCRDNGSCIHYDMICNGINDCMDGSDEFDCGKLYNCVSIKINLKISVIWRLYPPQIATEFFSSQFTSKKCLDQHTKNAPECTLGIYA